MQLQTGHIALNKYLHHIHHVLTPNCPNCDANAEETIHHYLFKCEKYNMECSTLYNKLHRFTHDLPYLLSHPKAIKPLLNFIDTMGRLRSTFSNFTVNTHQPI